MGLERVARVGMDSDEHQTIWLLCAPAIVARHSVLGPGGISRAPWHHASPGGPTTETGSLPRRGAQLRWAAVQFSDIWMWERRMRR